MKIRHFLIFLMVIICFSVCGRKSTDNTSDLPDYNLDSLNMDIDVYIPEESGSSAHGSSETNWDEFLDNIELNVNLLLNDAVEDRTSVFNYIDRRCSQAISSGQLTASQLDRLNSLYDKVFGR